MDVLILIILNSSRLRIESRPTIAQLNLRIYSNRLPTKSLLPVNPLHYSSHHDKFQSRQNS